MIQSLKLCFNSEVHKVASVPKDFNSLLQNIQRVLKEDVPSLFTLQYEDEEGDKIIIATDDDYQLALKTELRSTSLKVYINDADEKNNISIISRSSVYELLQEEQANMDANVEQLKKEAMKSSTRQLPEVAPHHETITTLEEAESPIMILGTYKRVSAPITPQTTSLESPISIVGTYSLKKKSETKKLLKKEAKALQDDLLVEIELEDLLKPKKKKVKKPVHSSIRCDDCGVSPIVGTRYQCSVIVNYDLCEECEAKGDHPYPLLKLRDESQIPSAMMVLYGEDVESPSKKSKKSKKNSKKNKKSKASDEEELLTMLAEEFEGMNFEDLLEFADAFDEEDSEEELAYPGQLVVNTQPVVKVVPQTPEKKPATTTYPLDVTNKAQCVFEIFPHRDFHDVCRYIADSPTKTLQEIVLDYMVAC